MKNKRALVFCGGGSKGAYQMGVWEVLRELNIDKFDIVCGTSIGALNAVMYCQNDFDSCMEIWNTTRNNTVMTVPITVDSSGIRGAIRNVKDLLPFLRSYIKEKGADIKPFRELMEKYIDPKKVKESPIKFGLVTVEFPSMKPVLVRVNELPEDKIIPYVLASASCFPLFPVCKIDDKSYIDGGYFDNLPIDLAISMGAKEIVAIDLDNNVTHIEYVNKPYIKYIYPSQPLGGFFDFKPELIKHNRILGYNDALKSYGKCFGFKYTFSENSIKKKYARGFYYDLLDVMKEFKYRKLKTQVKTPEGSNLFEILEKDIYRPLDINDYYIRGIEETLALFEIDYLKIYNFEEARTIVFNKINEIETPLNSIDEYFVLSSKSKRREYLKEQDSLVILNELTKLTKFNSDLIFDILEVYPEVIIAFILYKLWLA